MESHPNSTRPAPAAAPLLGMLVTVQLLRRDGRRVTRQELAEAPPLQGRIKIEDAEPGSGMIRYRNAANLYNVNPRAPGKAHVPLFNPVIEKWDESGIVLSGFEVRADADLQPVQYVQVWLVKPAAAEADEAPVPS